MKHVFHQDGNNIRIRELVPADALDHVPEKIYTINIDDSGPFLKPFKEKFKTPKEIYGLANIASKIIYEDYKANGSSSAILHGVKGTGKTLTMEAVANKVLQSGRPVIYIDENVPHAIIKYLVSKIGPCAVIFDEFTNSYSPDQTGPGGLPFNAERSADASVR